MEKEDQLLAMIKEREMNRLKSMLESLVEKGEFRIERYQKATASLLSTADVCKLLGFERHRIYKLIESGELRAVKYRGWKFRSSDIEIFLATKF